MECENRERLLSATQSYDIGAPHAAADVSAELAAASRVLGPRLPNNNAIIVELSCLGRACASTAWRIALTRSAAEVSVWAIPDNLHIPIEREHWFRLMVNAIPMDREHREPWPCLDGQDGARGGGEPKEGALPGKEVLDGQRVRAAGQSSR